MLRPALLALLLWSFVVPAQAWTRAHVREADVELALEGTSSVRVALELGVEVSGGWLERLEIPGLAALPDGAEHFEAVLTTEDGAELRPEVRLKHGVLELRLPREAAARRGHHRLVVRYALPVSALTVAAQPDKMRFEWTLPGWEAGLNSASIHWLVPTGSTALPDPELAEQVTRADIPGQRTKISFARVHVPRESSWQVAVEVPMRALAVAEAASGALPGASSVWRERAHFALACAFVLLLAVLARRTVRARAAREGWSVRNLWLSALGMHERSLVVVGAALSLSLLAVALSSGALSLALALVVASTVLFLDRVDPRPATPSPRPFEAIGASGIRLQRQASRRERVGFDAAVDASNALGACGIVACAAALFLGTGAPHGQLVPWLLVSSCSAVPLLMGARWRFPRSLSERVHHLLRAAEKLELQGVSLALVWRRDDRGGHDEARLRVFSARPHHGLLRIDVLADSRRGSTRLVVCAVVLADSGAARALEADWPAATIMRSGSAKRIAFVKGTLDPAADLERLLEVLGAHEQRSLEALSGESARDAA